MSEGWTDRGTDGRQIDGRADGRADVRGMDGQTVLSLVETENMREASLKRSKLSRKNRKKIT